MCTCVDEHGQEEFHLKALLFVTINDWPALSNLSGQTNKGYRACTHCLDDTDSMYLANKNVYLGHRRFLPSRHPVRKKGKHYNGKADHRPKPAERTGAEVVEELLQLWNGTGVRAWDEHMGEEFDLKALLFVTINDWPALSNLSGQTNNGYRACTHCLDDTDSIYLANCKKNMYLGHRRFLPKIHPVRKKGKHFKGEADHRTKPRHRTGADIHDIPFRTDKQWIPRMHALFGRYRQYIFG